MNTGLQKIITVLAALLAFTILAGCSTATQSPPPSASQPTSAPAEPTAVSAQPTTAPVAASNIPAACQNLDKLTLKVMPVAEPYALGFRNYEADMQAQMGDISFNYDMTTVPEAFNKIISDFALGTSSYDIVLFQPANLPDIADYLEPIGDWSTAKGVDFSQSSWLPRAWALYTQWNGKWVTMPWDIDAVTLFYNKAAFENQANQAKYKAKYGTDLKVPETFDEYAQVAEFFNGWDWAEDGRPHYGTLETWAPGWAWYMWQPRFAGYGGQYFDKDMKPLINGPAGVAALKNMIATQKGMMPGANNTAYGDQETAFSKGDVAMVFSWASMGKAAELGAKSTIKGKTGNSLLPGALVDGKPVPSASLEGGWSMGVPKYSKNKDAALCVVWFMSQPSVHEANSAIPDTAIDSGTITSYKPDAKQCTLWQGADQFCKVQEEAINIGFPEIYLHGREQYMDALNYEVGQALTAGKDPQKAMDDAAAKWEEITNEIGRDKQIADWATLFNGTIPYQPPSK